MPVSEALDEQGTAICAFLEKGGFFSVGRGFRRFGLSFRSVGGTFLFEEGTFLSAFGTFLFEEGMFLQGCGRFQNGSGGFQKGPGGSVPAGGKGDFLHRVHEGIGERKFAWQEACNSIARQEEHHRRRRFQEEYVEFLKRCGLEYEEQGLWRTRFRRPCRGGCRGWR
jgi:hypothetical protein